MPSLGFVCPLTGAGVAGCLACCRCRDRVDMAHGGTDFRPDSGACGPQVIQGACGTTACRSRWGFVVKRGPRVVDV